MANASVSKNGKPEQKGEHNPIAEARVSSE
jgi:hypothetical protein